LRTAGGIGAVAPAKTSTTITPDLYLYVGATERLRLQSDGNVRPGSDNAQNLGSASFRWGTVFAGTGTINTSDARLKTNDRALSKAEKAAALEIAKAVKAFQYRDAVELKGKKARVHIGLIAQEVEAIMEKHKLDAWSYGFLCRDEVTRRVKVEGTRKVQVTKTETVTETAIEIIDGKPVQVRRERTVDVPVSTLEAVTDMAGNPVMDDEGKPLMHSMPVMVEEPFFDEIDEPAGDRLGLRYEQIAMFCIAALAK
jgi:hypothetical protein